jgi:alkylation response protein AidB-like acyl-CoA dehydrogenase
MDALAAARDLLPLIRGSREETESQRRIAAPVVAALRAARLFRIALPTEQGDLALAPVEALSVFECLAGAEASVSWIVWNNALPGFFGRFLKPEARAEIFGNPDDIYAGSTRPSGRAAVEGDHYRVNGRW